MKKLYLTLHIITLLFSLPVFAESAKSIFSNPCEKYRSSEDYVKSANLYCLNQSNSRACFREARSFFKSCNYEGNFKDISQEIQKKLLVMLLFSKSRDLAKSL